VRRLCFASLAAAQRQRRERERDQIPYTCAPPQRRALDALEVDELYRG
jgi:hypothetical protein